MPEFMQNELVSGLLSLAWSVLWVVAIQGGLLLVAAHLVISTFGAKMPAFWRHRIWSLTLCAILILPLLGALDSGDEASRGGVDFGTSRGGFLQEDRTPFFEGRFEEVGPPFDQETVRSFDPTHTSRGDVQAGPDPRIFLWTLLIWAIGVAAVLSDFFRELVRVRRIEATAKPIRRMEIESSVARLAVRLGLRRSVRVRCVPGVGSPFTLGCLHPKIFLPESATTWSRERLEMALVHELVHIKRLDVPVHVLLRFACALVWFNPLGWRASALALLEREKACDDEVLRSGVHPADYAEGLVRLAREQVAAQPTTQLAPAMAQTTELRQRLTSILDPNQRRRSGGTRGAAVAVLSCTAALLLVSTWQPVPTSILAFPVERAQAATPDPHLPTLVHYGQTLDRALADVENNPEIAHDVAFLMLRIKEFFLTGETFQIETMHLNSLAAEARYHELKRLYRDDLRARLDQSIPELLVRGLGPGAMRDEAERYLASNNDTDLYLLLLRSRDEFVSSFYRPYNFFSPSPSLGMKTPTLGGVAALALVVSGEDVVKDLVSIYESGHGPETKNARWALRNLIWPEQRELADRLLSEL